MHSPINSTHQDLDINYMRIGFTKYHGAGNDFILIDNRDGLISLSSLDIQYLCHRHYGIGSDGLILLENTEGYDFLMRFYNPDGGSGMMCGNGGRCIVAFAFDLGIISKDNTTRFLAADGEHSAIVHSHNNNLFSISLSLIDVDEIKEYEDGYYVNTGTSHFVRFVDNNNYDIIQEGRAIRYDKRFSSLGGSNANFVIAKALDRIEVRTYERGVEAETLACGTGITASALAQAYRNKEEVNKINIKARGGELEVSFQRDGGRFTSIFLKGEAQKVFDGEVWI